MNEQVVKILQPIKNFWGKQSKKKKTVMISVLVGILLTSLIIVVILNIKQYATLYTGLDKKEAIEVINILQEKGVDYKAEKEGTTILVEKSQEPVVRMQLATDGYPKTAPDYSLFEGSVDFMTTDSEKRTFKIFQLQERLQDSICTIKGIEKAIVTLVAPEESGYVWEDDKKQATASVTVTLASGGSLDPKQVSGIKRLVSTAVQGLTPESIAVIDASTGNELNSSDNMNYVDIANFKLDIEKQFQKDIESNVMKILVPLYGKDNATVALKGTMNLDKKIEEIITYTPSNEDGKGMLENEKTNQENVANGEDAGGVPGTEENADLPNYTGVTEDGKKIYYKNEKEYKYLVNKATKQITGETPVIEDLTVAVTVNRKQVELSEADKDELSRNIAFSAGVSPAKVSIFNAEYTNPANKPIVDSNKNIFENKVLVFSISAVALLLLIGLLVVLMVNKKIKKKKAEELALAAESAAAVPSDEMPNLLEDLKNVPESKQQVLKKEIQDFTETNPEIVAQLLRTWLKGDDGDA